MSCNYADGLSPYENKVNIVQNLNLFQHRQLQFVKRSSCFTEKRAARELIGNGKERKVKSWLSLGIENMKQYFPSIEINRYINLSNTLQGKLGAPEKFDSRDEVEEKVN